MKLIKRWNRCVYMWGEYGGIVVCVGENRVEETERTEPFCAPTRLNTGGLHRITLLKNYSGKKEALILNLFCRVYGCV